MKIWQVNELRTIFLGMDQSRDELLKSDVKGKNPLKDLRVRQAFAAGHRRAGDRRPHHARPGACDQHDVGPRDQRLQRRSWIIARRWIW